VPGLAAVEPSLAAERQPARIDMRLALVISSLFPWGGLQRECVTIARALAAAGHQVTIVTADYRAPVDTGGVPVEEWRVGGLTNPGRDLRLGRGLRGIRDRFDRIVGFNKMPNLDIYFSGDPSYRELGRSYWRWLSPKFHQQLALERQVFGPAGPRLVIVVSDGQIDSYRRRWGTGKHRFRLIPPTLDPGRRHAEFRASRRDVMRRQLGIGEGTVLWLAIASAPRTKGLDRTIRALARRREAALVVVGLDPASRPGAAIRRQATRFGADGRIRLLGYRDDISELMAASDLLVHPARLDTTGMVILEAIVNGLPAVATSVCGFASHVEAADAGIVIEEPFRQEDFERALAVALDRSARERWSQNGAAYGKNPSLTSGHVEAVKLILATPPVDARESPDDQSDAA
jgi:UDP-glucose:(heptosyl)LPS alpha-1,3-glucosyltransferase